jgi:hypothetical protein
MTKETLPKRNFSFHWSKSFFYFELHGKNSKFYKTVEKRNYSQKKL